MSRDKIEVNLNVYDIPIIIEELEKAEDTIRKLEKENKILRQNAEHNDKVVDKVNWEINILKNNRDKAIDHLDLFISDTNLSKYDTLKILMYTKKLLKGDSE